MRLAQVECEALSHRFPREKPKGIFRVSMFRVLFRVLEFLFFLGFVVDNKLFCITTGIINARNTTPTEERIRSSICDAKANIYTHTYI